MISIKFVFLQVSQPDPSTPVDAAAGYGGKTQLKSLLVRIMIVRILNVGILESPRRKEMFTREIHSIHIEMCLNIRADTPNWSFVFP